jgi:hypothetical protein
VPEAPHVFISYSHDSEEHKNRVWALAAWLRSYGVNAQIDEYLQSPPRGWPAWCEAEIRMANFVLLVCTETYLRRFNGDEKPGIGHGAAWEANLIRQHLYHDPTDTTRFVPILLADASTAFIPTPMKGHTHYRLVKPPDDHESLKPYESLYRRLTHQPRVIPPDLGPIVAPEELQPLARLPPLRSPPVYGRDTDSKTEGRAGESEPRQVASTHVIRFVKAGEALQSRLFNILERGGLYALRRQYPDGEYAEQTLYMMAQYFASVDYLLNTPYASDAYVNRLTNSIENTFATDRYGTGPFCIFRPEQTDLGRLVRGSSGNEFDVKSFSEFRQTLASPSKAIQDILSVLKNASSMAELDEKSPNVGSRLAIIQGDLVHLLNYIESKEEMPFRTSALNGIRLKARSERR